MVSSIKVGSTDQVSQAIIFDLNGIFVQSERLSDRFERVFNVPSSDFIPALKEMLTSTQRPNAEDPFLYMKDSFKKWSIKLTRNKFLEFWFSGEKMNQDMVSLARNLKARGVKCLILSNNLKERTEYYHEHFPFLTDGTFDHVYYSWQTGFVKPSRKGLELLLKENGLTPEECLYFDDQQSNVDLGNQIGINSFLFRDSEQVKTILENHGVL